MRIDGKNESASVSVVMRVSSPTKVLCEDELTCVRAQLANGVIDLLRELEYAHFSLPDGEITVTNHEIVIRTAEP